MALSAQLVVSDELGCLRLIEVPAGPRWEASAMTRRITQPARMKSDTGAGIVCMTADPLLPRGWAPGAQAVVAVGRADGRADVVAVPSGRVLASARAPTHAAVGAAAAQAPRPQREVKHEQLADDPRRVVALAFFLSSAGAGGGGGGGGAGGGKSGGGSSKQKKGAAAAGAAGGGEQDAQQQQAWPRLLVLHGTGLACIYSLGPEVLQQATAAGGGGAAEAAAAPAAAADATTRPPLAPEATFQASLNARCAALDPAAAAAVRAWRLPGKAAAAAAAAAPAPQPPPLLPRARAPLLAVGSEGTALSLYDLSARARVWQAKSPKPDRTGLAERPYHTAVAFLPGVPEEAGGGGGGGGGGDAGAPAPVPRFVLLVGTAAHKVHAYDTAIGKRPQASTDWGNARITTIVPQQGPAAGDTAAAAAAADFWVADGAGRAGALELRGVELGGPRGKAPDGSGGMALRTSGAGAAQGVLRGAAGSVRAVAALPARMVAGLAALGGGGAGAAAGGGGDGGAGAAATAAAKKGPREVVAVAGLDRHVRIYDARSHACVGRVYAKQQLTGMVWAPPAVVAGRGAAAAASGGGGKRAAAEEEEEQQQQPRDKEEEEEEDHGGDRLVASGAEEAAPRPPKKKAKKAGKK